MSDAHRLRLEVVLQAVDRATRPFRSLMAENKALARAVKEGRDQLTALNREQKRLDGFRELKRGIKESGIEMRVASEKAQQLRQKLDALEAQARKKSDVSAQLKAAKAAHAANQKLLEAINRKTGNKSATSVYAEEYKRLVTAQVAALEQERRLTAQQKALAAQMPINRRELYALRAEYKKAQGAADTLTKAHRDKLNTFRTARSELLEAGIRTKELGRHEAELKMRIDATKQALREKEAMLTKVAERERHIAAARQTANNIRTRAGNLAAAGAGASAAGMATGAPIWKGIGESKHYELEKTRIAALGLGDAATKESIEFAKQMKAYGVNRTASNLLAQMYLQRDQIHKNMRLNRGADGIEQLDARAKALPQGKEIETLAKVHDLQKEIGEKVLPLYASALEWVARAASGVTKFMQENPGLAKAMAVGVGALAASLLVLGPIMLAIASVLGPYAMLYLVMGKMGIAGGVLSGVLRGLTSAFTWVMRAVVLLGRALLLNPIGLLVTAIGVAAYLIYQYWEPISGFFRGLWGQVKEAFNGGIGGVSALVLNWSPLGLFHAAFATVMQWFGIEVPTKFTEFGANIIRGLANGIKGAIGWVVDAVGGVADRTIGLFKEKLGIHSPSRVFAALGAFTMAGLQEGLADGEGGPLGTVQRMASKLAGIGAGVAIGTAPALAVPVTFDTRPPLSTSAVGVTAAPAAFGPITINIYPQAGMDPQAIAHAVRDELRKIENQNAARARSRLSDRD